MRILTLLLTLLFCSSTLAAYKPEDFAGDFVYKSVKISPDGEYLAVKMLRDGKHVLVIFDMDDKDITGAVNFDGSLEVGEYYWVNRERLVVSIDKKRAWQEAPITYGELYAVDYNGRNGEVIFSFRGGESSLGSRLKKKKDQRSWAEVIHPLPNDDNHVLIKATPMVKGERRSPFVHKLNVYTGVLSNPLVRSPVPYSNFITDNDGNVVLAQGWNTSNEREVYLYNREERGWEEVPGANYGNYFSARALDSSGENIFVSDNFDQDRIGLFTLNLASKRLKHVYTHAESDITGVSLSTDLSTPYALRVDPDYPTYLMLNQEHPEAKIFKSLLSSFPGSEVAITSRTEDAKQWVIYTSSETDPGSFFLLDLNKSALTPLYRNIEKLNPSKMLASTPFSFTASDGMTLHGYVTVPETEKRKKVPLVVLVHGGPHGIRDYWDFDREVQMLANQGYAVLRVNYRGSSGYGLAYEDAGKGKWGGRVQEDIIDATRWLISKYPVDGDKVCIMGASFGAYSAVQSAILAPDLYDCVVANAGVYDLGLLNTEGDIKDSLRGKAYLAESLGTDKEQLIAFSPAHAVEKLQTPVLLAHGKQDQRAPFAHAELLQEVLEKHGKSYVTFFKDSAGHGFYREHNRAEYYQKVAGFLARYLDK